MCKWIMDLEAIKHMISHRAGFGTYKVITLLNVYLGDNGIEKAIRMGSINIEVIVKDKNKKNLYQRCPPCPQCIGKLLLANKHLSNGF